MRRLASLALPCALVVSAGPGCGKTRDCNALAEVTNRRSAEIVQIESRASETPETLASDMTALSDVADRAATDVHDLPLSDETVATKASDYETVAHDLADASRSFSTLMDSLIQQREAQAGAQKTFDHSGQALLDACATASASCNDVGDVLRAQPKDPAPDKLVSVLESYVAALEALELEESPVQRAVDARVAAAKAYAAIVEKKSTLDSDIDAARSKVHTIVARQNALIDELNVFCVGKN
ncbi:MAG: hypothetical protein AAGA54_25335 [Myxococcota bacterium]